MREERPILAYPPTGSTEQPHAPLPPHPPSEPVSHLTAPHVAGDVSVVPVVSYEDLDPAPSSGSTLGSRLLPRRRNLFALLSLLLAGVVLLLGLRELVTSGSAAGTANPGPVAAHEPRRARAGVHHSLGPITLPPPLGTVPRTVPLDTIWIIDKQLPAADQHLFAQEAPTDVSYLYAYSLPKDQLGFALSRKELENVRKDKSSLVRLAAHPNLVLTARPHQRIYFPPARPGYDQAIVIITTRPEVWRRYLPVDRKPRAVTADSPPGQTRTYLVDLVPGSGWRADPLAPGITQPQRLIADPAHRGSLARALARVFVDAIGARWQG